MRGELHHKQIKSGSKFEGDIFTCGGRLGGWEGGDEDGREDWRIGGLEGDEEDRRAARRKKGR